MGFHLRYVSALLPKPHSPYPFFSLHQHPTNHPTPGFAKVETDRETVRKYYSPSLKAWIGDLGDGTHDGGPEDPRIGIIKVDARTATYAISRVSILGRAKEMAQGVISGEAPKVNKLREISEEEINTWRTSQGMVQ